MDKRYFASSLFGLVLAGCSFIGMIHAESVALFPPEGVMFGVLYLMVAAFLAMKGVLFRNSKVPLLQGAGTEKLCDDSAKPAEIRDKQYHSGGN